jgi:hypothetical protein
MRIILETGRVSTQYNDMLQIRPYRRKIPYRVTIMLHQSNKNQQAGGARRGYITRPAILSYKLQLTLVPSSISIFLCAIE